MKVYALVIVSNGGYDPVVTLHKTREDVYQHLQHVMRDRDWNEEIINQSLEEILGEYNDPNAYRINFFLSEVNVPE